MEILVVCANRIAFNRIEQEFKEKFKNARIIYAGEESHLHGIRPDKIILLDGYWLNGIYNGGLYKQLVSMIGIENVIMM